MCLQLCDNHHVRGCWGAASRVGGRPPTSCALTARCSRGRRQRSAREGDSGGGEMGGSPRKAAITAAEILNDRVLPFFEDHGIALSRVLTDRGITSTSSILPSRTSTIRGPRP